MLEARFLGKFEVRLNGIPIDIPARKAQSLFAYLIMNPYTQHRRERVAGMLWPDVDEPSARSKLRYALWQLRSALGDEFFLGNKVTLAFNFETDFWVDCIELGKSDVAHLIPEQLKKAVDLYQGEFLPGFYDDWILLTRDQQRVEFDLRIAELVQRLEDQRRWQELLDWAERWISLGDTPERAYQALMIAYSQLGDKASAIRTYQRLEKALEEELGVDPADRSKQLYQDIQQGEFSSTSLENTGLTIPTSGDRMKPFPEFELENPDLDQITFVAREGELAWLDDRLRSTLDGNGQVAFAIGDSGVGKTSLLRKFGQHAQTRIADLIVVYATCESFSGVGDPFLPFRNILALLTGDVAVKRSAGLIDQENAQRLWEMIPYTSQAITESGPDLLESFINGGAFLSRASSYPLERPDWLEDLDREVELRRNRPVPINIDHGNVAKDLLDQYSQVLHTLSRSRPLLLILDDLQWADPGTCELLFHIMRRIEGHRILILGSYRPADVTQRQGEDQHPLVKVLPEIRRKFGREELNLDKIDHDERMSFVNQYLNSEQNKFDSSFNLEFFKRTKGHPLFTVELLRQMEEQGNLIKDDQGYWVAGDELSWDEMPEKIEAVIEGRINRLSPELREILSTASLEGEEFSAELIAAVMDLEVPNLVSCLSRQLDRQHKLIEISEIRYVNEQRISVYRFRHSMYRQYIYENLDIAQRAYLHEKVGLELEKLYGGDKQLIAAQLARHFEISRVNEKAVDYYLIAGKNARRVSANEPAIEYLNKGIELLNQLPEGPRRYELELALYAALGPPLVATEGYASKKAEVVFERTRRLCEITGDSRQLAPALWGLCAFYQVRGKHLQSQQMAKQIMLLAEQGEDPNLPLLAFWMLGITHTHLAEFSAGRDHLKNAIELYDSKQDDSLTYLFGQNPKVTCLIYLALNLWMLGNLDQALARSVEAIDCAEKLSHPYSLAFAHGMSAVLHALRGDSQSAVDNGEAAYRIAKKAGFPFFLSLSMIIRGWGRVKSGRTGMATRLIENGIEGMRAIGVELALPFFLSLLAEVYAAENAYADAISQLKIAYSKAETNHELWYISGLNCLSGKIHTHQGKPMEEIVPSYLQAIEIAIQQQAKTLELQAAIALVKLQMAGEEIPRGKELLGNVLLGFNEGTNDPKLAEARQLFARLSREEHQDAEN